MLVLNVDDFSGPISNETLDMCIGNTLVLTSKHPVAYLQGISDAAGVAAILIGRNGAEIQLPHALPFSTECATSEDALILVRELLSNENKDD